MHTSGEISYDGMSYLWVNTEKGPRMLAEIRGYGANLPQDDNAQRLVACWNALEGMEPSDLPAIFSALENAQALLLQTSAAQEKTHCMAKIDAAVARIPKKT